MYECMKANRKLTVLTWVRKYLDINKIRVTFKAHFDSV